MAALGVGLAATDRLDDVLRAAGARPKPRPDARDIALAGVARAEADRLVEIARAEDAPKTIVTVLEAQAAGLPRTDRKAAVDGPLATACGSMADRRAKDAIAARSSDLAVVLGSLSAGLAQVSAVLKADR